MSSVLSGLVVPAIVLSAVTSMVPLPVMVPPLMVAPLSFSVPSTCSVPVLVTLSVVMVVVPVTSMVPALVMVLPETPVIEVGAGQGQGVRCPPTGCCR